MILMIPEIGGFCIGALFGLAVGALIGAYL